MKVTLSQIKSWFKKGMYPTESQFANAFDSFWHKDDTLPLSAIQTLTQVLNDKASVQLLETKANADHKHTLKDITDIDNFKIEVDAELSKTSENPVQNKAVKEALDAKQPIGNYLTEHQDISGKQDKTDNSLLSTAKTIVGAINELWEKVKQLGERISDGLKGITHITYAELKALRDNDGLPVGTWYRITDYETTVYNNANARAAGHPFDILVLATDVNQLSEDAKAVRSARDTEGYFAHANLAAWRLKYSLDNDVIKFAWASEGGEKWSVTLPEAGTVQLTPVSTEDTTYEGHPYKFIGNFSGMNLTFYFATLELVEGETSISNVIEIEGQDEPMVNHMPITEVVRENQLPGKGVIWEMEDEYNNLCCYDFKNIQFKRSRIVSSKEAPSEDECAFYDKYMGQAVEELPALPEGYSIDANDSKFLYTFSVIDGEGNVEDNSMGVDLTSSGMGIYHLCSGNTMKPNVNTSTFGMDLNNTVFVAYCASADDLMNLICLNNTFEMMCFGNTFGNSCHYNSFGDYCYRNSFGNSCYDNSFGNGCDSNTFGNSCYDNSFGNYFCSNSCGNYFQNNSFGNYCQCNSFGNYFCSNSCGNYFQNNSFGNSCYDNSLGNSCYDNSFGNGCQNNDILDNVQYITAFEGVMYVSVGSTSGTVQYAQILNGTKGSDSSNKLQINFETGKNYTQVAGKNSSGELKIWVPADMVPAA